MVKYTIVAAASALIVGVGGYTAMANMAPADWQTDLLDLAPIAAPPGEDNVKAGNSKARRAGGRKFRSRGAKSSRASTRGAPATGAAQSAAAPAVAPAAATPAAPKSAPSLGDGQLGEIYKQGLLHLKHKKVGMAIDSFDKVIAMNPNYAPAFRTLGISHTILGNKKTAMKYFEKFVVLAPDHRDTPRLRQIIADFRKSNP